MSELGIELPKKTDNMGMRIIDAPKITASVVLNSELEVVDWVRNVETSYGTGVMPWRLSFTESTTSSLLTRQKSSSLLMVSPLPM